MQPPGLEPGSGEGRVFEPARLQRILLSFHSKLAWESGELKFRGLGGGGGGQLNEGSPDEDFLGFNFRIESSNVRNRHAPEEDFMGCRLFIPCYNHLGKSKFERGPEEDIL